MADWAKLTTNYYLDPAVACLVSDAAEVLFTRAIAYVGHAETAGIITKPVLPGMIRNYTPAREKKLVAELVAAGRTEERPGLWEPVEGGWRIRSWERINADLDALSQRRKADRDRQSRLRAQKRAESRDKSRDEDEGSRDEDPGEDPDESRDSPVTVTDPEAEAEAERDKELNPLLNLIGRLAGADARTSNGQPAEFVVASWQRIAGPDVDLEDQAASYLTKHGMRPARDEAAAWAGWLRKAALWAAKARGVPAIGCDRCLTGWLPDEYGYASERPCPTCKPHTNHRSEGAP